MFGYVVRRILSALIVLVATSFLTFAFFYAGPTNPAAAVCFDRGYCTDAKLASLEHSMGLDDGLMVNYGRFMGGLVHDREVEVGATYHCDAPCLGISFRTKTEVTDDIVSHYPATLSLALGGALLYLLVGLPLGVLAARFRGSWIDKALVGGSLVVTAIPYYVLALAAWIFFSLQTGIFSTTGYFPVTEDPRHWFTGLLLPWLVLGLTGAPTYVRYVRAQVVEAMGEDYIRSGRAKGVSGRRLLFKHALRVALVPVVTIFGLDLADLLSGTIFTESIFRIDGIGALTLGSLKAPTDFPVLNATILLFAAFVVFANLAVDLIYTMLDPRVRLA